jgi:hypothetical protein
VTGQLRAADRRRIARRLERAAGALSTTAVARMEQQMPWFRDAGAEDRSWIGLVVQAGIREFVAWFRHPDQPPEVTSEVFGAAPSALAGVVSLQQTVEMVRTTIEVVEEQLTETVGESDVPAVREAINRYAREVAFSTAEVYAKAAELRGAWDARLEALVVDSLLRGDVDSDLGSRASALGWQDLGEVAVVLGPVPPDVGQVPGLHGRVVDDARRAAREAGYEALAAVHGDRLVVVLGGASLGEDAAASVVEHFAPGPVVVGPTVLDLIGAVESARVAAAALHAAKGWPDAPRPVSSDALLPERALAGDDRARRQLVEQVYRPLLDAGSSVLETTACYLDTGGSVEAAARALFVHANTVRYRLRRTADVVGLSPHVPRDAYTLRVALTLGRLASEESEVSTAGDTGPEASAG